MSDFKAKMHQIRFRLGLCPRPRWGSVQCSPDPLAGFKGAYFSGKWGKWEAGRRRRKGREREGGGGREKGSEGKEGEGKREGRGGEKGGKGRGRTPTAFWTNRTLLSTLASQFLYSRWWWTGGTDLLMREPFTQLPTSMHQFSSFELSSLLSNYFCLKSGSSISIVHPYHLLSLNFFSFSWWI